MTMGMYSGSRPPYNAVYFAIKIVYHNVLMFISPYGYRGKSCGYESLVLC